MADLFKFSADTVIKADIFDPIKLRHSWRAKLRAETGGGADIYLRAWKIARGEPLLVQLPDGTERLQIPSIAVQLDALRWLGDKLDGSAVGEDKLLDAEQATSESAHLRALSEDELTRRLKQLGYASKD
jgi:hypothetical protein